MSPMKILIDYDESPCSSSMLVDLKQAGLPDTAEAVVLSFAEVWLTEPEDLVAWGGAETDADLDMPDSPSAAMYRDTVCLSVDGRNAVMELFPTWNVQNEAHARVATRGTIEKVMEWQPDLVIVGSHRRSALGRLINGSVGQTLLSSAPCSVRIARAPNGHQIGGLRIVLAVDGSIESDAAVRVVAARTWPAGTVVRVVSVYDQRAMDTGIMTVTTPDVVAGDMADIDAAGKRARIALEELKKAGLLAQFVVASGSPCAEILDEARRWGADAIFMGARGHGFIERALMGSVSNAVAMEADCSVEVVRVPELARR